MSRALDISSLELKIKKLELMRDKLLKENDNSTKQQILISVFDRKINSYKVRLEILKTDDSLKTEEIALINKSESIEGKYTIYSTHDYNKIGYITYSPEEYESEIGSIGYAVLPPFRGNNYAYKSLKLLSSYLSDNGVDKISVVADENNTGSVRVMEKFSNDIDSVDESDKEKGIKKYSYRIGKQGV